MVKSRGGNNSNKQVRRAFSIGKYKDAVLYDVVPM